MTHEDLLEYRVSQLEERLSQEARDRKGRPSMIATIVMSICAIAQVTTTILLATGALNK